MLQKCLHGSVVALFSTKHGHQILWLPPYSPDLNPIEKMWAWVKAKMHHEDAFITIKKLLNA